jgi:hypothetical protein
MDKIVGITRLDLNLAEKSEAEQLIIKTSKSVQDLQYCKEPYNM